MYMFNVGCPRAATCSDRSLLANHCCQRCCGQPIIAKLHYDFHCNDAKNYGQPCWASELYHKEKFKNVTHRASEKNDIDCGNEKFDIFSKTRYSEEYHQEKFKNLSHVIKDHMLNCLPPQPEKSNLESYIDVNPAAQPETSNLETFDVDNLNNLSPRCASELEQIEKLNLSEETTQNGNEIDDPHHENELYHYEKLKNAWKRQYEKKLCKNGGKVEKEKPHYENELFHNEKMKEVRKSQLEKDICDNDEKLKNLAKIQHENELYNDEKLKNQVQAIEERRKTKESLFATNLQFYSIWADKVKREITPEVAPIKEKEVKNINNPRHIRPSQSYGFSMSHKNHNQPEGNMFWGAKRDRVDRDSFYEEGSQRGSHFGLKRTARRRLLSENFCDRNPQGQQFWGMKPKLPQRLKLGPDDFWGPMSACFQRNPRPRPKRNQSRDKNYEAWISMLKAENPGVVLREEKLYEQWLKDVDNRKHMMKDLKQKRNYLQRAKNPNEAFPSYDIENLYWTRRKMYNDSRDDLDKCWPE